MKYLAIVFGLVTLLILIGGVFFISNNQSEPPPPPTGYEYYWGDGCPHCAKVQEFFDSWENKDKVQIDKRETWSNPQNQALMTQRARACNVKPTDMGVPFLVTPEGECIGGDQPIIDYFKNLKFE